MIYPRDHGPPHVHIVGQNGRAKIALNCPDGSPLPIEAYGMDSRTLRQLLGIVAENIKMLCEQ